MSRMSVLAIILCLFVACGDERNYWLDGKKREPKPSAFTPEVFVQQKPSRPYKEIALIRFKTEADGRHQTGRLRDLCRARGGDAVILSAQSAAHNDPSILGDKSYTFTDGVVIEYTDATPP